MTVHLLLTINSLRDLTENKITFNKSAISAVRKMGISNLTLYANMDSKNHQGQPLRLGGLVEYIESTDLTISKVIAPMDIIYKKSDNIEDYRLGDAYRYLVKPLESALGLFNLPSSDTHLEYVIALYKQRQADLLRFLIEQQFIFCNTTLTEIISNQSQILEQLKQYLLRTELKDEDDNPDYGLLADEILPRLLKINQNKQEQSVTDYLEELAQESASKLASNLPELAQITEFYKKLVAYRNFRYQCVLMLKDDLGEQEYKCLDTSKGALYQWDMLDRNIAANDTVIFCSDSLEDIMSVEEAHKQAGFAHKLVTIRAMVPHPDVPPELTDPKLFEANLANTMRGVFDAIGCHAAQHANFSLAVKCFDLAYLYSDSLQNKSEVAMHKDALLIKRMNAYKSSANELQRESSDSEEVDRYLRRIQLGRNSDMLLNYLELQSAIHQRKFPHVYSASFLPISWSFTNKKSLDADFLALIRQIKTIAGRSADTADIKERCALLATLIGTRLMNTAYKDKIEELKEQLKGPIISITCVPPVT